MPLVSVLASLMVMGAPSVSTGLEVLEANGFRELAGKNVGLITNPTGIDSQRRPNIDVMRAAGVKLVALFGPEHGVRGNAAAGETVKDSRDPVTGLPEYSLYGRVHRPTSKMLSNVDALVFDMQDIGSRSYTYIKTLGDCMQSAAEEGIPFYVLDRPNPLGGEKIEGNITEPAFRSGVSPYPIPYLYGLTVGELAQMINGEGWSKKSDLHVVKMAGWNRSTLWFETGLPWVPTSPHVPRPESAFYYAATGIVGELDGLSIGIGVLSSPFELAGAPKLPATEYAQNLSKRSLPGYQFAPVTFSPTYAIFKGQTCSGVQIGFTDYASAPLTRLNFELMDAARAVKPSIKFFASGPKLFDKVCGTDKVRKMYQAGKTSAEIWAAWNSGAEGFRVKRAKYLLY